MGYATELTFDDLRVLAFGSILVTYTQVGAISARPARLIKIVNTTDQNVRMSTDGVNDKDIIPANGFTLYDFTTNKVRDDGAFLQNRASFFVRHEGVAPTSGNVYVVLIGGAL